MVMQRGLLHKKAFYGVAQQLVKDEDTGFVHLKPSLRAKVRTRN